MLNFEEELMKFKPSLEIDDIEDALYQESLAGNAQTSPEADAQANNREDRD